MKNILIISVLFLSLSASSQEEKQDLKLKEYISNGSKEHQKGEYYSAVLYFTMAINHDPTYVPSYFLRGSTKEKLGDKKGAISDYSKLISLDNNIKIAYQARANLYMEEKDYYNAIGDFNTLIGNPNFNDKGISYYMRGVAKTLIGDFSGAIKDLNIAATFDFDNETKADIYYKRCYSKAKNTDFTGACYDCKQAQGLGMRDADFFKLLQVVCY